MAKNRICLTCGEGYEYCSSCPSSLSLPVWKNLFHEENCKTVFETVSDYEQNVITKESAREKLSKCDLSHANKFKEKIKELVQEIMENEVDAVVEEADKPVIKRNVKKKMTEKEIDD